MCHKGREALAEKSQYDKRSGLHHECTFTEVAAYSKKGNNPDDQRGKSRFKPSVCRIHRQHSRMTFEYA